MGMFAEIVANGIYEDIKNEIQKIELSPDETSMGEDIYLGGYVDGLKKAMTFVYKYL